ncbi:MAG: 2-C-methyl-D-erythritol 4-phosphate cytidylyltransferase [Nocardioidaceae bacterium]|nr:2-C-methyl-D-erythritol 4-phosphate cytidylyltransferase [Nocardioidaceae bacterium]
MTEPQTAVVILAAGSGARVGAEVNKVLLPLEGTPVVAWSVRDALETPGVGRVLLVVRAGEQEEVARVLADAGVADARIEYAVGGSTRHGSEWNALQVLAPAIDAGEVDVVAIHDAARPRAGVALFVAVIAAARRQGGAVPVVDLVDVTRRDGSSGPERLAAVQTPQAFIARRLLAAYAASEGDGFVGTDTASCLERYAPDLPVAAVPGDPANLKITFARDFVRAADS